MSKYLQMIKEDAKKLPEILEHFNQEYEDAKKELKIEGNLQQEATKLPSYMEYRFSQLQELEAILEYFNIKLKGVKSTLYQKFMNTSARALTSNDVKQYIEGDKTVIEIQTVINDVALVRNRFVGLTKGFDAKNFMISNIVKLRVAGLDSIIV